MSDLWTHIVSDRLGDLALPAEERHEVIEEVAAHLRELAEALERDGATDAPGQALAQISDWPRLAKQIRRAKEERMAAMGMEMPDRRIRTQTMAWVVAVAAMLGAGAGFAAWKLTPPQYRSQALIQVTPPQVPSEYVRVTTTPLADRLQAIEQIILSRTRLESIVKELDLYSQERTSQSMQEVIERFRTEVSIQVINAGGAPTSAFSLSYVGSTPVTVMRVTEKLAALFKQESMSEGERRAQGISTFLESEAEDAGRRLQAQQAKLAKIGGLIDRRSQLETQVLEATYVKLLTDLESARMQINLAGRQIGEQFTLIDAARLPERPIGPTPAERIGIGALVGFAGGVVLMLTLAFVRMFSSRPPQPLAQTA